jgi:succinyl-CoA synthetase beta subunit
MKIHEYQAKELFAQYDIPVQKQVVITKPEEAADAVARVGAPVVVKAQVLVGGRGKAGGVKLADTADEAVLASKKILGLQIKTEIVEKLLIAPAVDIKKEYYLGVTLDRTANKLILMISKAGGVDIEELAVERPEEILRYHMGTTLDPKDPGLRKVLQETFDNDSGLVDQATDVVVKLHKLMVEKDCSLVEINPYALVEDNQLLALDAKVNFDDNALYKHPDVEEMKNPEEYSQDEIDAKEAGLSFVSMDGDIGCIVNGAGLAMATMDIIKLYGGNPANFLDVGGSSNPEKVVSALRIITQNPKVKAILINIFGGITRCDDIANGILMAMERIDIKLPMVIRLIGTNDKEGVEILSKAGFDAKQQLSEAVQEVVSKA